MLCTVAICGTSQAAASPSKTIVVLDYPSFLKGVESITLAPMENVTSLKGIEAGIRVDLLRHLKEKSNIIIIDRIGGDLYGSEREMLEQERRLAAKSASSSGKTRLILFTTLNEYRTEEIVETRYEGRRPYTWRRNEGHAAISIRLVNVETGETVLNQNFLENWWATGSPPDHSPSACVENALKLVMDKLIETIKVPSKTITLNTNALRTAAAPADPNDPRIYLDKFVVRQKLSVVLDLPKEADSYDFILDIVIRGQENPIVSRDFKWDSTQTLMGHEFSLEEIAAKNSGSSNYTVRLFQKDGMKLVLTHDFLIIEVKEEPPSTRAD